MNALQAQQREDLLPVWLTVLCLLEQEGEGSDSSEEDSDSSDDEEGGGGEEDEDDEEKEKVNENFRLELMKVLQGKNALVSPGRDGVD